MDYAYVATVSGSAFGSARHVRLSYAIAEDDVAEGLARIEGSSNRSADTT